MTFLSYAHYEFAEALIWMIYFPRKPALVDKAKLD